jgi:hypothetical protein
VTVIDIARGDRGPASEDDRLDRGALSPLDKLPNGATASVVITGRRYVTDSARAILARHWDRLDVQLTGDHDTLLTWESAVRGDMEGIP